ncbi:MAG: DUF3810 domain-containing protein [Sedimentibacter sp.]
MSKRILVLILIPVSLLLTMYARFNLSFAEYYALKIYPVFAESISFFTSKFKFSLAEFIIIALIITIIICMIFVLIKTITEKSSIYIKNFFLNMAAALSIIYFLFVLFGGINYYRNEFTYYSGLEIKESSTKELIELCEMLINDANEQRANLKTDSEGTAEIFDVDYNKTTERARKSFDNISQKYQVLKGSYPAPKPVLNSKFMSQMRITGVFFPFTFEANVNVDIPKYQVPATMLHELAHLRGFMREDEANFISYMASINSGFNDFEYSGTMLALSYSMSALYKEDKESFTKLYNMYSNDVKNDLRYSSNYWKQFETKVAEISNKVNDSYLKVNNQEDGVKSYGRMVDLLLAYYSKD